MLARTKPLSSLSLTAAALAATLLLAGRVGAAAPPADPGPMPGQGESGAEPGHWQAHSYVFNAMTFTSTYSCDGLADKLKLLLRLAMAREDAKVDGLCSRGYGVPDKLAQAKMTFSTLSVGAPGAAASGPPGAPGVWRHVEIAPQRPFELQLGDCELVERFRDVVLPMFATRDVQSRITCVPHQESGSNFTLGFDVFAAVPPAKSP
jgi:hypothetical protein